MKKYVKILLLVCVALTALTVLCSCDVIDELKAQRVVCVDEEKDILEYKGEQYYALPNAKERDVAFEDASTVYLVEEDIPLLFIQDLGSHARYEEDKDIISHNGTYYCTKENFDKYSDILKNSELDCYRSYRYIVDDKKQQIFTEYFVIDDETVSLIKDTAVNVVGRHQNYYDYSDWEYLLLDACDSDNLIVERDVVQLYKDPENGKYGIKIILDEIHIVKEFHESAFDAIAELFDAADFEKAHNKAYGLSEYSYVEPGL